MVGWPILSDTAGSELRNDCLAGMSSLRCHGK
jgi:hypothetical protein